MKKQLLTAALGLMLFAGSFIVGTVIPGAAPVRETALITFDMSGFEVSGESQTEAYTVIATSDGISMFDSSGEVLFAVDCSLSAMPEADRELLQNGMVFATKEEALEMIENFAE
ncbi:MAG: hypothetical protein LBN97_02860 [Oscillospiraceae bacterium]|jgi:hypothetical protein|nr:hypothetical protein [Oscillospiraceae bacterium]